jgi:hypothetical protein
MDLGKKRVGVAENPRSGVGARGSSVKKGFSLGKRTLFFGTHVLSLFNLLTVPRLPRRKAGSWVLDPPANKELAIFSEASLETQPEFPEMPISRLIKQKHLI